MTLSVGVIGLGVMGAEHLRLLREETAGVHVAAICDADAERAGRLAQDAEDFTDPLALIASDRVEAVVIASVRHQHPWDSLA
jgi:myo-inositol 2-dehydrogenase/D-chiro-inositol 1-dehydrogenase